MSQDPPVNFKTRSQLQWLSLISLITMLPGSKWKTPISMVGKPLPTSLMSQGALSSDPLKKYLQACPLWDYLFWKVFISPSFTELENTYINQLGNTSPSLSFVLPVFWFLLEWAYVLLWVSRSPTGLDARCVSWSLFTEDYIIQSNHCVYREKNQRLLQTSGMWLVHYWISGGIYVS